MRADRRTALLTAAVGTALLVRPGAWRALAGSSSADALTPQSWRHLGTPTRDPADSSHGDGPGR